MTEPTSTRTRDPARKEKILAAAAQLIARDGYHAVSLSDIGREAGIVGSGVYRHFNSKIAILVALFEGVIDDLLTDEQRIVDSQGDLSRALDLLIDGQVEFAVGDRAIAQVYHHEISNLPAEDPRPAAQAAPLRRGLGARRARAATRPGRRHRAHPGACRDQRDPVDAVPQRRPVRRPAAAPAGRERPRRARGRVPPH